LHGVRVEDPYRWLEDEKSPEVRAWMDAQDAFTRAQLAQLPGRDAIAARLRELYYIDSVGIPYHYGSRYFYSRRHADREKGIVYWKEGKTGAEKVLLDPNTWSTDGSQSLGNWAVSWDGKHVAFTIKKNNSDEATLYVLDVATGKRSEVDVIEGAKYAHAQWNPRGDGFYYAYLPTDKAIPVADRPGYTEIRYHRLGEDPKLDRLVRANTGDPKTFLNVELGKDGRYLFIQVLHGWNAADVFYRDLQDPKGKDTWTPLTTGQDALYHVTAFRDRFYVHTNEGASRYRVFDVDPKKPARAGWSEIVPEAKDATLEGLSIVGGKLSLLYMKDVINRLELRGLDGKNAREIRLPGPGASSGLIGQPDEDEAHLVYTSLTTPNEIYE
ncbi:MAG: S9 family peptidase, partial [Myxococcales bacterium]